MGVHKATVMRTYKIEHLKNTLDVYVVECKFIEDTLTKHIFLCRSEEEAHKVGKCWIEKGEA